MIWSTKFRDIVLYDSERINRFGFDVQTCKFLTNNGLPKYASPFLSFVSNTDTKYEGILRLTDCYDFLSDEFNKYILIGSNGNGDEIVIDTKDDCKIKLLDHENNFSESYINSSIEKFANALEIYQEFVDEVLLAYGSEGIIDNKYSIKDIEKLQTRLLENEKQSMTDGAFWTIEMDVLLSFIEDERN